MKKYKTFVIVILLILLFISLSGCVDSCGSIQYYEDFFYNIVGDRLINNEVTIGIGNSAYDEDNNLIAGYDPSIHPAYYKQIIIEIYVDDNESPVDTIEIPMDEYNSYKYHAPDTWRYLNKSDYSVLFEFNVLDYQFSNKIRFGVKSYYGSYDSSNPNGTEWRMEYLDLNGEIQNGKFIVHSYKENDRSSKYYN